MRLCRDLWNIDSGFPGRWSRNIWKLLSNSWSMWYYRASPKPIVRHIFCKKFTTILQSRTVSYEERCKLFGMRIGMGLWWRFVCTWWVDLLITSHRAHFDEMVWTYLHGMSYRLLVCRDKHRQKCAGRCHHIFLREYATYDSVEVQQTNILIPTILQ